MSVTQSVWIQVIMISYGDPDYVVVIVFNCTVTPVVPRQPLLRCMILLLGNVQQNNESKCMRMKILKNTIKLLTSSPQDSSEFNHWKTFNSCF